MMAMIDNTITRGTALTVASGKKPMQKRIIP
jgi:hypothetical protein